jgi:hypothetical protein
VFAVTGDLRRRIELSESASVQGTLGRSSQIADIVVRVEKGMARRNQDLLAYGYATTSATKSIDPGSPAGQEALERFVRCVDRGPAGRGAYQSIEAFVLKYGPLGLCADHGLPASHNSPPPTVLEQIAPSASLACIPDGFRDVNFQKDCSRAHPESDCNLWGCEPVNRWIYYAKEARELTEVLVALKGRPNDTARVSIAATLNKWAWLAGLRVQVSTALAPVVAAGWRQANWAPGTMLGEFGSPERTSPVAMVPVTSESGEPAQLLRGAIQPAGIFGLLATSLILAAARGEAFAVCTYCFAPFIANRLPRGNQRNWCPECKAAGRHLAAAQRRHRSRSRLTS